MTENKKFVIRCRAIIIHDGKLLVVKHAHDASFVALPGGKMELGEKVRECMSRELVEELNVVPKIGRLLYVYSFMDHDTQSVEFFFEILNGEDYQDIEKLKGTHAFELADIAWVSPNDEINLLPKEIAEYFKAGDIVSKEIRYL